MRRVSFFLTALFLITATAATAEVSNPVPFSIYAGGGISFPIEPDTGFTQDNKSGPGLMAGIGVKFMPALETVLKVEYHRFPNDLDGNIDGAAWQVWLYGASVKAGVGVPTASVRPFASAGFGVADVKRTEGTSADTGFATIPEIELKTAVYFDVGGGFEWSLTPQVNLFVTGRYVYISTEGEPTSIFPLTIGLKLF